MTDRLTDTELKQFVFAYLVNKNLNSDKLLSDTNEKDVKDAVIEANEKIKDELHTKCGFSRAKALIFLKAVGLIFEQASKAESKKKSPKTKTDSSIVSDDENGSPGTPILIDSVTSPKKKKTGDKKTNKKSKDDLVEQKKIDFDEAELDEESIPEELVV